MKRISGKPLTKLADAAFEQAAKKVIELAKESGTPVIVWENESVTKVQPGKNKMITTSRPKRSG